MKNHSLIIALVLLATTVAYANSLRNPFVIDDRIIIFNTFRSDQSWTLGDLFQRSLFSGSPSESIYFRPLTLLTFALNYPLARETPLGYRAVNLIIHLIVISVAYLFLCRIVTTWVTTFALLLFALHPANVQAVSYISSRSDPLYTVLALSSLLLWHKGSETQKSKRPLYFVGALSAFFLGLFAKENMVVVPALAAVMDLTWNRSGSWRKKIRGNLIWYLGFLFLFSIYILIRFNMGFRATVEFESALGLGPRLLLALKLFGLYLALAFYPVHLSLFRLVPIPGGFFEWGVVLGAILLAGFAVLAYLCWSTRREISFGVLWFLISTLPLLNLILLPSPLMEHWLYLPLIGLTLAFVSIVRTLAERAGKVRGAAFGLILLALLLSTRTFIRNAEWGDLLSVLSQNVSSYPKHFKAWAWLGDTMKEREMFDDAIRAYKTSLALNPDQDRVLFHLGELLSMSGQDEEAEKILSRAAYLAPRDSWLLYTLGLHRLKVARNQAAIETLEKSIGLNPHPITYHVLGSAYVRLGQKEKAEEAFRKAMMTDPGNRRSHAGIHLELGKLFLGRGKPDEAREEWQLALRFDPDNPEARTLLKTSQGSEKS